MKSPALTLGPSPTSEGGMYESAHTRRAIYALFRTCCVTLVLLIFTGCSERQIRIHFENAARQRAHGHIDSAMAEYRAILELDENASDAANALGSLYAQQGDYHQAIAAYHHALQNSDKPDIHFNLGLAFSALGLADSAIAAHERVVKFDPKNSEAHNALGTVYATQSQIDKALKAYRQALEYDPQNADAYLNIGLVYAAKKDFTNAIQNYQNAIQYRPNFASAYNNLASAYAEQGQYNKAIPYFEQAVKIDPQYQLARNNLAHAKSLQQNIANGEMRASHILVATEKEARNILQKLKEGATFEALARLHSQGPSAQMGGDLGGFMPGDLMPAFEQAVKNIAPDQVGGPVKTPAGYHIIKRIY